MNNDDDDDLIVNFDDFDSGAESDLGFGDDEFDNFDKDKKGGKTLGDLWRDNPLVKIGIIVGAIFLLIFILIALGGKKEEPVQSVVDSPSQVSAPPGTEQASPAYIEAVKEENENRVETAIKEGTSALPTPIAPPVGRLTVPEDEVEQEDPLQRWRRLQEERLDRELSNAQTVDAPVAQAADNTEAIQAMSEAMATQMQAVLETRNVESALQSMLITDQGYLQTLEDERQAKLKREILARSALNGDDQSEVLLRAAEIEYAQILTEANSDVPGPVLAQIVSGPLAGSRLLGSFTVQEELLTVTFDTIVLKNGEVLPVNAIALDPDTTLPGMATDVDHRYFKRIVLPAAAAFVEGAAEAISDSGRTTITVDGTTVAEETDEASEKQQIASGVKEAGEEIRDILEDIADDVQILVRIHAGTPMAVLFIDPVVRGQDTGAGTAGNGSGGSPAPNPPLPLGETVLQTGSQSIMSSLRGGANARMNNGIDAGVQSVIDEAN